MDALPRVNDQAVRPQRLRITEQVEIELLLPADDEAWLDSAVRGERDPYAGLVWPASIAAARALLPELQPGARVLDAGSGTGVVALAAATAGAAVTAMDYDSVALSLVHASALRAGLSLRTLCFDLRSHEPLPPADFVVFADVLYQRDLSLIVAGRAVEAHRRGTRVLVADPGRMGREAFSTAVRAHGHKPVFHTVEVTVPGEPRIERVGLAWLEDRS
jgi:predicted nicotinamide N-methyase